MRVPSFVETVRARLAARGVSATMLAVGGFVIGLIALPLIAKGHFWIGLGFMLLGRCIALLGAEDDLARALSLIAFAGIPFAFALADPARAVAACFLLFGFVAVAAVRRLEVVEQFAAAIVLALACLMPSWFSLIAYGLGIVCFAVAGMRLARNT
jgi:hypothetical protein